MRLQDFLDLFDKISFYIFDRLVFILIQGDAQYLLDIGNIQFYLLLLKDPIYQPDCNDHEQ